MKIKLLSWFYFFAIFLVAPACQNAFKTNADSHAPLKQEKQIENGYETINRLSRKDYHQRAYATNCTLVHAARISRIAKAVYGGANDLKRPRSAKGGSSSLLLKSNSLLSVVLRHVAAGLLVCALY